jgi:hypothetical protein
MGECGCVPVCSDIGPTLGPTEEGSEAEASVTASSKEAAWTEKSSLEASPPRLPLSEFITGLKLISSVRYKLYRGRQDPPLVWTSGTRIFKRAGVII